jgi:hypothetical protein
MLQQIETILKSNWSSEWFDPEGNGDNTFINPKFKSSQPVVNLNKLTDKLVEMLVLNSRQSTNSDRVTLASLFKQPQSQPSGSPTSGQKNEKRLRELLIHQTAMPDYLYEELVQNATIDRETLYSSYMDDQDKSSAPGNQSAMSFDKSHRTAFLHGLFCDPVRFNKLVQLNLNKSAEETAADKQAMQRHLCNMSSEQAGQLDSILTDQLLALNPQSVVSNADSSSSLKELELRMKDYVLFLSALDDLAKLSIHFPTGMCTSKDPAEIMRESEAKRRNSRPEALINEKTMSGDDSDLKSKLKNNYGFIGLWYSMQKTFCGAGPSPVPPLNPNATLSKNATNETASDESNKPDDVLSKDQLKALSLLFHVMYSNPIILYSPNTTVIRENIIRKTNGTFALIDKVSICTFSKNRIGIMGRAVIYFSHKQFLIMNIVC